MNKTNITQTIIAHRSASGYLPEHSLPAVAMAYAWGVDYVEPDIVLSSDGVPIVLHDIYLDTTTNVAEIFPERDRDNGRYYAVDFTEAEIKLLSMTERFDIGNKRQIYPSRFPVWRSSFRVPTFGEYIEMVQGLNFSTGKKVGVCPEIKAPAFHEENGLDIVKITYRLLCKYGYQKKSEKAIIQCFEHESLERLKREFNCRIPLMSLLGFNEWGLTDINYKKFVNLENLKKLAKHSDVVGAYLGFFCEVDTDGDVRPSSFVADAHKAGLKVHAYTHRKDDLRVKLISGEDYYFASNSDLLRFLFDTCKIDGIFTDFADVVIDHLKQ